MYYRQKTRVISNVNTSCASWFSKTALTRPLGIPYSASIDLSSSSPKSLKCAVTMEAAMAK